MAFPLTEAIRHTPTLVLGVAVTAALYYLGQGLVNYQARRVTISKHACKPPSKYPLWDPLLGLDVIYNAIRAVNRKTFLSEVKAQYDKYGTTHSSRLTTFPVINTIEPENIKAVLSTNFKDFVVGSTRRRAFGPVIANSILVADGAEWEHSRAFLKPSFTRSQVGDLATLEVHVKNLIQAVPRDGSTVDLAELFLRFTADVTTDVMFGESILSLPQPEAFGADLTEACRTAQLGAERRFRLGVFANVIPQPAFYRAVNKVHAYIDSHVDKAIQEQRRSQKEGSEQQQKDESHDGSSRYIFLKELAKMTDDRLVLRDQLLGIFLAGRDTTAALLSNLFFVLARNPAVHKRLQEEIATALNGRAPSLDDLKGLKYLSACLNEIQGTSRIALKDVVLPEGGGEDRKSPILVTAGTLVIFHLFAMHKRPDLWGPDAEEFRPERWEDEKASWKFLPFGGGPRNCIGQQFALTEASYTATRLLQSFSDIENRDPKPWTESIGATLFSANGVKVALAH
ncbi:MAG: hypothetical protein Q9207_008256 [Kuettlingeria erythrocarpa]